MSGYSLSPSIRQPLRENRFRIPKSRYDSVDLYLSKDWINRPEYNDNDVPYDEGIYNRLTKENGMVMRGAFELEG